MGVHVEIRVSQEYPAYCTKLLEKLFANYAAATVVKHFTEGESGTFVFLVELIHETGEQETAIVKIGPHHLLDQERHAAQVLTNMLPNFVPISEQRASVHVIAADGTATIYSAARYASVFPNETLRNYVLTASDSALWALLDKQFFPQLHLIWSTQDAPIIRRLDATYDRVLPVNLLLEFSLPLASSVTLLEATHDPVDYPPLRNGEWVQLHNFVIIELDATDHTLTLNLPYVGMVREHSYRLRIRHVPQFNQYNLHEQVANLTGRVIATRQSLLEDAVRATLPPTIALNQTSFHITECNETLPNPLLQWPALLYEQQKMRIGMVHGDLNMGNVLLEVYTQKTFIIDGIHAHWDHIFYDLVRLESEVLLHMVAPHFFAQQLPPNAIYHLYMWLDYIIRRDPHPVGIFSIPKLLLQTMPQLQTAFITLMTIRNRARQYLAVREEWREYYAALALTLLGSLKFASLERLSPGIEAKAVAFWGVATLLENLKQPTQLTDIECEQVSVDTSPALKAGAVSGHSTTDTSTTQQPKEPTRSSR